MKLLTDPRYRRWTIGGIGVLVPLTGAIAVLATRGRADPDLIPTCPKGQILVNLTIGSAAQPVCIVGSMPVMRPKTEPKAEEKPQPAPPKPTRRSKQERER